MNFKTFLSSFVNSHQAKWESQKHNTGTGKKASVNPLTWNSPEKTTANTHTTTSPAPSQQLSPVHAHSPKFKRDHSMSHESNVSHPHHTTSPLANNRHQNRKSQVFDSSSENKQVKLDKATADWASQLRSSIYDDKKPKMTSHSTRPLNSSYGKVVITE